MEDVKQRHGPSKRLFAAFPLLDPTSRRVGHLDLRHGQLPFAVDKSSGPLRKKHLRSPATAASQKQEMHGWTEREFWKAMAGPPALLRQVLRPGKAEKLAFAGMPFGKTVRRLSE